MSGSGRDRPSKIPMGCALLTLALLALLLGVGIIFLTGSWHALAQTGDTAPSAATRSAAPGGTAITGLNTVAPPLVVTPLPPDTPAPLTPPSPVMTPTATPSLTPSPTPTAAASSAYPLPVGDEEVEEILARMTMEQKVGQMLMVGLPLPTMDAVARRRVIQQQVGGIILLERNTTDPGQVASFTDALQEAALSQAPALPLLIGWNYEGGPVVRRKAQVTAFPSAMALGAAGQPQLTYQIGEAMGQEMRSLGVNVNFAPVFDVNSEPNNPVIGLRAFGDDPALVAEMGRQFVLGQQQAGVIAAAKHFPGHGAVDVDSHVDLPLLQAPLDVLQERELPPFRAALEASVGSVMIAHLRVPALEPDGWPASLSPRIVDGILRQEMGFDGVVMTDDMGMGAIVNYYSLEQASVQAVLAGNDLLLMVETQSYPDRVRAALLDAVNAGTITPQRIDDAVRRILRLKLAYALGVNASPEPLPQKQAHLQLAARAGRAAVQLLQDEAGWLPLALPSGRLLVVSPSDINAGGVEGNGLSLLGEILVARGLDVVEQFYLPEAPWSVAQVQSEALRLAPSVDGIVVLTSNAILRYAHFQDTAQETLVRELLDRSGLPTIVVFSQLPYDRQRMPQAPTQVATYGATAGQLEGLAALLVGD